MLGSLWYYYFYSPTARARQGNRFSGHLISTTVWDFCIGRWSCFFLALVSFLDTWECTLWSCL